MGSKELMKRPESIDAKLIRFKNGTENWIAFVGLVDDRPYEVFTGINNIEDFPIPSTITEGKIIKVKDEFGKRYDFQYVDKYGYTNRLGGLSRIFNQEYWNYAKLISALLRGGIELDKVVKIIDGMHFESDTLNTWKNGVKRAIKTFIVNGTESHELCPDCGDRQRPRHRPRRPRQPDRDREQLEPECGQPAGRRRAGPAHARDGGGVGH